jgi:autotransporter-associated beta strand protein
VIDVDSGIDATIAAAITGSAGLTKLGGGRLVLAGTNTYSGTTEVTAGTLDLTAGASLAGGVDNSATFISAGTCKATSPTAAPPLISARSAATSPTAATSRNSPPASSMAV